MFLSIFVMEMLLKIYGLGPSTYFRSTFNTFDFVVSDCPGLDKTYSPWLSSPSAGPLFFPGPARWLMIVRLKLSDALKFDRGNESLDCITDMFRTTL
jgi:hypothetical protein